MTETVRPTPSVKDYVTLFLCMVECFLFGGTIFGWNVLVFVMKEDGIYSNVCSVNKNGSNTPSENTSYLLDDKTIPHAGFADTFLYDEDGFKTSLPQCPEQSQHFATAYAIAIVAMGVLAFPGGILFDKAGLMVTRTIVIALNVTGFLILGFVTPDTSFLIYPGCALIAIPSVILMVTNNHVCTLARARTATFISLYSGMTSTSGIVFQFVKLASGAGISRKASLLFISSLWILVLFTTYVLLPRFKVPPATVTPPTVKEVNSNDVTGVAIQLQSKGEINEAFASSDNTISTVAVVSDGNIEPLPMPIVESEKKDPTYKEIVFTTSFLLHLFWFSGLHLRMQFFIGSFNQWVTEIVGGDTAKVSILSDVYGYGIVISLLFSPITGLIADWNRKPLAELGVTGINFGRAVLLPLSLASLAASLLSGSVLVTLEWMTYVSIILSHVSRAFLYSSCFSFLGLAFPGKHYGKLYGLTYFTGGIVNLLQYVFLSWADAVKTFVQPNIAFLVIALLTFINPFGVWWRYHRYSKAKAATIKP